MANATITMFLFPVGIVLFSCIQVRIGRIRLIRNIAVLFNSNVHFLFLEKGRLFNSLKNAQPKSTLSEERDQSDPQLIKTACFHFSGHIN